ncbi:hypothetical protein D3C77_517060 [compost metagenome]
MCPLICPLFKPEASPVSWTSLHGEIPNHHVIDRIQKDERPLVGGNRAWKSYIGPLNDLSLHAWTPVDTYLECAAVMDGEHFIDRVNLSPHVVIERANAI